jgi:hypothetical protein
MNQFSLLIPVIRATVPKLDSDDAFEQKNDITKTVKEELGKVSVKHLLLFNCRVEFALEHVESFD